MFYRVWWQGDNFSLRIREKKIKYMVNSIEYIGDFLLELGMVRKLPWFIKKHLYICFGFNGIIKFNLIW